eukprot:8979435-Pyramimonas_sp.AAC.2
MIAPQNSCAPPSEVVTRYSPLLCYRSHEVAPSFVRFALRMVLSKRTHCLMFRSYTLAVAVFSHRRTFETVRAGRVEPEQLGLLGTERVLSQQRPSWLDLVRFGDGSEESGSCSEDNSLCHVRVNRVKVRFARRNVRMQASKGRPNQTIRICRSSSRAWAFGQHTTGKSGKSLLDKKPFGSSDRAVQIGRLLQYPTLVPKKPPIPNVARCRRQLKALVDAPVGERKSTYDEPSQSGRFSEEFFVVPRVSCPLRPREVLAYEYIHSVSKQTHNEFLCAYCLTE